MCGRFTLKARPEAIAAEFGLAEVPLPNPRFNIAPTQAVAAMRLTRRPVGGGSTGSAGAWCGAGRKTRPSATG